MKNILLALLDALKDLHPDDLKLEHLRAKDSLTLAELREVTLARHGYIHRDIKPENVILVPNRGPVLIDFGISVRVAEAVKTVSSTPGYLPPDGVYGQWTPDVDLYQLGLTGLQFAVGVEYDGSNIDDLRRIADEDLSSPLSTTLLRMTESSRDSRFESARQAMKALAG